MTSLPIASGRSESDGLPPNAAEQPATQRRRLDVRAWLDDSGLDLRNTWQIVAGAILLPVGIAVIVLGWAGAAHGRVDQQQIPYLISGGILGLAFVVIGAFFFWAHWLYRIYDQADMHHQAQLAEQREFYRALLAQLGGTPGTVAGAGPAALTAAGVNLVATPTGTNVHTADCPIVANRAGSVRQITRAQAEKMKPCRICEPLS